MASIVTGFLLLLGLQSAARADVYAYMNTVNRSLGTIDLNTGEFSLIGATDSGVDNIQLAGLGEIDSSSFLYGASYGASQDSLYTINTATGALTFVGGNGNTLSYVAFGSTLTGLYALAEDNGAHGTAGTFDLYSVATSGTASFIANTGLALGGDYELSTNSSTLYFTLGTELYTLNTTNGAATDVGPTGGGTQFQGLITEGGVLYGGQYNGTPQVDTIASNGAASSQSPAANLTGTTSDFDGLAPTVPEPTSVLLFGTLIAGVFFLRRKKHTV